jgi:hypothetical protein
MLRCISKDALVTLQSSDLPSDQKVPYQKLPRYRYCSYVIYRVDTVTGVTKPDLDIYSRLKLKIFFWQYRYEIEVAVLLLMTL